LAADRSVYHPVTEALTKAIFLNTRGQSKTQCRVPATNSTAGGATWAIHQLFQSAVLFSPSSAEIFESDVAIQRCVVQAGEQSEVAIDHYVLVLWEAHVAEFELASADGHYRRYKKHPNTIKTIVPGFFPARICGFDIRHTKKTSPLVCATAVCARAPSLD
jgi:hypothetical protein